MSESSRPVPVGWTRGGGGIWILDQTRLPEEERVLELRTLEEVEEAIASLRVRGAPLIGITAAMGVAALAEGVASEDGDARSRVEGWCDRLSRARPTAVNLGWALDRMREAARTAGGDGARLAAGLRREADAIREEDEATCRRIGEHALELLGDSDSILTHCNTGALATGGVGTAAAPLYLAAERGRPFRVYVGETRPLLQGARLTAWELGRAGMDVTVMADGAAGWLMARGMVDAVLVGADRVAANGDVANKVGTYALAVLARRHGIPFYVLAPTSTLDPATPTGGDIPIEERSPDEIRRGFGAATTPPAASVWNPAFDVTPADLVTALVTEEGASAPGAPR